MTDPTSFCRRNPKRWRALRVSAILAAVIAELVVRASTAEACTCDKKGNCTFEGTIVQSIFDYPNGATVTQLQLKKHDNGDLYDLHFAAPPEEELKPGNKVKVHGKKVKNRKALAVGLDKNGKSKIQVTDTSTSVAPVTGTKSLAVIVISSLDVPQTVSDAQLDSLFFSGAQDNGRSISGLYRASSYGSMSFSKAGIFRTTLNYNTAGACNYNQYSSDAMRQLGSINANYFLYIIPTDSCGWAGLGMLCSSGAWIPRGYALYGDVNAHELGHNVCLHHAAINPSNDGSNQGEYNDTSCIMGYGGVGWRHFNAPHKDQSGWVPASRRLDVSSSTSTTIAALEADPLSTGLPYMVRLPRGQSDYYYVSYRSALDAYSVNLPNNGNVSIHRAGASPGFSYLIANLAPGQTWTDSVNGATISFTGASSTSANLTVSYGCVRNAPTVTLQPSQQITNALSAKAYLATVRNNDSVGCGPTRFSLTASLPPGLSAGFDSSTMDVNSGGSASSNVYISADGSSDGTFAFTVSAGDGARSGSANGQHLLDRVPPPAPGAVTAKYTRKGKSKGVTLTISNLPDDRSGFAGNNVYVNGVKKNSSLVTNGSFRDAGGTAGTTYQVTEVDRAGNEGLPRSATAN